MAKTKEERSRAAKLGWITRRFKEAAARERPPGMTSLGAPFITKWFKNVGMSQIYSSGLEFAFVSREGEQCHAFAYCKDFLQDAVWATINKSSASIYGFSYTHGTNPPVDMDNMRMAVRLTSSKGNELEKMCLKAVRFLREVDKVQGFEPTDLLLGGRRKGEKSDTFVFVSDSRWLYSPVMVSWYSLLVRVGMTYEGGDWRKHFDSAKKYLGSNDNNYTNNSKKGVDKLVGKKPEEIFAKKRKDNYPTGVTVSAMHNSGGIVAFSRGSVNATIKAKWQIK
jgi:hypothetical protein